MVLLSLVTLISVLCLQPGGCRQLGCSLPALATGALLVALERSGGCGARS